MAVDDSEVSLNVKGIKAMVDPDEWSSMVIEVGVQERVYRTYRRMMMSSTSYLLPLPQLRRQSQ
jgi:hypothetical protein